MKALYVITGLNLGGAEIQVLQLTTKLKQAGHVIEVVSLLNGGVMKDEFITAGIPVHELGLSGISNFFKSLATLKQIIASFQPDIIHSHMVHANLFTRISRLFISVPALICTAHSNNEGGKLRSLLYRLTDRLADMTTNVSELAVQDYIRKKIAPADKICFMPNGIDIELFKPDSVLRMKWRQQLRLNNSFVFLNVGRIEAEKDQATLLHAFKHLKEEVATDIRLVLIGDGSLKEKMLGLSASLALEKDIMFLGRRRDVAQLMNIGDCFVLSSTWEGFGMAVAEAMATGIVPVVTACGGTVEISHPDYRFIAPVKAPLELASKMREVLEMDDNERITAGVKGRSKVVADYSMDSVTERWLKMYKQILSIKKI